MLTTEDGDTVQSTTSAAVDSHIELVHLNDGFDPPLDVAASMHQLDAAHCYRWSSVVCLDDLDDGFDAVLEDFRVGHLEKYLSDISIHLEKYLNDYLPTWRSTCLIIIIIFLPNNTKVCTSTSIQFRRVGQKIRQEH